MQARLAEAITRATGRRPVEARPLSGGCIGDVYRVSLEGAGSVVVKVGDAGSGLDIEGYMLDVLAPHLPVPEVLSAEPDLLVMSFIDGGGGLNDRSQAHAAELLAHLHNVRGGAFGLERDTLIGGLHQPNDRCDRWLDFFRHHRLLHMARDGLDAGRLPPGLMSRIERLAGRLEKWISEPSHPSLLHGDM